MMPTAAVTPLIRVVDPAVRTMILAACAGLALAAFRVKATSLLLFTWTAVLYAALAIPLLGSILPPLRISAPALLQDGSKQLPTSSNNPSVPPNLQIVRIRTADSAGGQQVAAKIDSADRFSNPYLEASSDSNPVPASARRFSIPWSMAATAIYLAVVFVLLARLIVGMVFSRRLLRAAHRIHDARVMVRVARRAFASGLSVTPKVAESKSIAVPVTIGALRSTILFPSAWRQWDDAQIDFIVAHEVSHVARRDGLTQLLSLLHRAIFWFSPLAWWLERHLADLAEQASDESALSSGADRNHYARTLLGFFEQLSTTPGRIWWQGVSMAKAGQAEKRLEKILDWKGSVAMSLKKSVTVAVIALAIPAVYLAAAVRPAARDQHAQDPTPPAASTHPVPPAAPSVAPVAPTTPPVAVAGTYSENAPPPAAPIGALSPVDPLTPVAGLPPVGPIPPVALIVPQAGQDHDSGQGYSHSYSYHYGDDDEQRFVIVSGNSDRLTMSGSSEDARHAEKLKKQLTGDFIWFERDEKHYIIRDQATVDRARKLWEPQEELGKKQEELGKQQEALGKQQEELGNRMEQVQVKVPDMTAELDKLKAELKALSSGATMEQVGQVQSEIGELQSKIGELQSQAGDQQSKLGELQSALGEKQGKLGEQQGKLGEQQAELAEKASRQMKELLDEAIKNGKAQPEPNTNDGGTI